MSVFNTPGYQVYDSFVVTNGISRDICRLDDPLTLGFTMNLGSPIFELQGANGGFQFEFCLYSDQTAPITPSWAGPIQSIPGDSTWTTMWVSLSWSRAGDLTNNISGMFNYRPRLLLAMRRTAFDESLSEFAVCPDEHYIWVVE
jgi:hypothetical protein